MWAALISTVALVAYFLQFTFVQENTAKIVMRFGGFRKAVMKWEGHKLGDEDDDWNVVPGEEPWPWSWLGGLRFVGIRHIDKIHKYKFRWRGMELVGGEEKVVPYEKELDYIFVKEDVYSTEIKAVETKSAAASAGTSTAGTSESDAPERIPIDLKTLVTMRVSNPYKALFVAPSNWFEKAITRFNALERALISSLSLDEVLQLKSSAEQVWAALKDAPLLTTTFPQWGILVEDNGIEIRDVDLPKEYQEAAASEKKNELLSEGFAAETTGRLIAMLASLTGSTLKVVRNEFKNGLNEALKKYEPVITMNMDLIKRRLGLGAGISEIHVSSPEGYLAMLANILHGGLGGGGGSPGGGNPSSGGSGGGSNPSGSGGAKPFGFEK